MAEIGKYIYGIIRSGNGSQRWGSAYAIPHRGIAAIVTDSEVVDYTALDREKAARVLVRHQRIIERVMESLTIIPMRLGTFASNENEVEAILDQAESLVERIFGEIDGKTEIDVTATWKDFDAALKKAGEEKEIRELKEELSAAGRITVEDQMKVGRMVKSALEKMTEEGAERIIKRLSGLSSDMRIHERMDDRMVINAAFIVENARHDAFYESVEELNVEFGNGLDFRCIGPLPLYSFFTLEVKKLQSDEVNWARKKLGLPREAVTRKEDLRKAYQAKAFALHPDRNPDLPNVQTEFDEVTRAYRLLLDYCRGESCSFNQEDMQQNSLIVGVRK